MITVSVTSFTDLGAAESFDEDNVDFAQDNVVAMEVEAEQLRNQNMDKTKLD